MNVTPKHYDDAHMPTEPGLYYWETCNPYGDARPGFYVIEEGKTVEPLTVPSKLFGPIPGALKPWPMTIQEESK
jgi:hypothetical protein